MSVNPAEPPQPPVPPTPVPAPAGPVFDDAALRSIQGIGIAGFRKDHQELVFFTLPPAPQAKALIAALVDYVSTAYDVGEFNENFSTYRQEHNGAEPPFTATWVGLALSASGLAKLGADLTTLPAGGRDAFQAGMAGRAQQIRDTGASAPANWHPAFRSPGGCDAVLVIASDEVDDLDDKIEALTDIVTQRGGSIVLQERGATLPAPLTGHEHFGFKDGASQPVIDGYPEATGTVTGAIQPGEFVLGYPDQQGAATTTAQPWVGGSFMVFRRLRQDVGAFRALVANGVPGADPAVNADQLGAKMIGRWPSGAPLAKYDADPGPGHEDNDFDYSGDPDGLTVPTWAHIRKVNPRKEIQPTPEDPARHRMIRRGIPFGPPLAPDAHANDGQERGLHFIAFVADVERQFEFVQASWVDDENFPKGGQPAQPGGPYTPPAPGVPGDGPDPIAGEGIANKALQFHQGSGVRTIPLASDLVTVTAGEYFFCPSIDGLKALAT